MRLLISFLALVTGFSAADQARAVADSPAALGEIAARASVALEIAAEQKIAHHAFATADNLPPLYLAESAPALKILPISILYSTPVMRADMARE